MIFVPDTFLFAIVFVSVILRASISATDINNIVLFIKEKEKGSHFDLGHWGKSINFSFTAGTRKRAHWVKYPDSQCVKNTNGIWAINIVNTVLPLVFQKHLCMNSILGVGILKALRLKISSQNLAVFEMQYYHTSFSYLFSKKESVIFWRKNLVLHRGTNQTFIFFTTAPI